ATLGAFIPPRPGKDGLLHVSEVRKLAGGKRVENVEDVLSVGRKILVRITKIDDRGKLSLEPVIDEATETTEPADTQSSAAASEGPEAPAEG
ncbi:S1 RNA-binding domain-containing protein, partial [Microbacterium sp. Bi128]|uniref:S1 RNA-binding domain-containing protein n=1 Tax=Microbacterium sp. Bi128 TaxID=2821115 RepID=UPI001E459976